MLALCILVGGILFFWPIAPGYNSAPARSVVSKGVELIADTKVNVEKTNLIRKLAAANEQEGSFYGRVLDQDNNPVVGAKIIGGAQYNNFISEGLRSYKTFSDTNGEFVFPKIKGEDFECEPWKEGYVYWAAKGHKSYTFTKLASAKERFIADPKKPEIFRLWKLKGAEVILCSAMYLYIPPDGTPIYLDMKTRKESKENGDVAFWCRYTVLPKNTPHEERSVEWKFGIKVTGGGVIATDSSLPFGAPDGGYEEEWTFLIEKGASGPRLDSQTFFIKTADQRFGVFNLEALYDPLRPTCSMAISWKINPSGSRNLEPGKEQMLRKGSYLKPGESLEYIRMKGG